MKVRGSRELVRRENPFVLGRYPDRPAPAHVLNGFVVSAFGGSPRGRRVRALLAAADPAALRDLPVVANADWMSDRRRFDGLRSDLSLILNPDRRAWEAVGSLVPVHAALASGDPSDDGFGQMMWSLVSTYAPRSFSRSLQDFLEPSEANDPVTACSMILVAEAEAREPREANDVSATWYGADGPLAGKVLAQNVAQFVIQLAANREAARPNAIQHLGRGVYFGALLCLLLGPIASGREPDARLDSIDELAPLVVWGDVPPGPGGDPMVAASARSYRNAVELGRDQIARVLAQALGQAPLPSRLPAGQRGRARLRAQLVAGGVAESAAERTLDGLLRELEPPTRPTDLAWAREFLDAVYPSEHVAAGLRSMGRKVGLVGPDRGAGQPRFLLETPLLGTLVAGLCPLGEPIPFDEFVDRCRNRLGLVLGPGSDAGLAAKMRLWEGRGVGARLLQDNQEALRRRMIRAGLATEYSDGHTEVFNDAV